MLFDGKKGQLINNSIHKIDSFTLLIMVIIEFYKRKYKQCRNRKQQRHFKTVCLFFLFSKDKFLNCD